MALYQRLTRATLIAVSALALSSGLFSAAAKFRCTGQTGERWMKEADIRERVTSFNRGEIIKLRVYDENRCYVADVKSADGKTVTLYLNPVTGEIAKEKSK